MAYFASIHPNKIVKRYLEPTKHFTQSIPDKAIKKSQKSIQNLSVKRSSFLLSYQSKSKIKESINLLYELSKPRTVFVSSKKSIFNFRASFITLTLPSKQVHNDLEIKKCLNLFLTRLRQTYDVKNYVWKAELQQNENIHFHLIIDKYIHFKAVRYYWNKSINTLGYVDHYAAKMSKLTLKDYAEMRGKPVSECLSSYQFGNATKWQEPPTEQAVSIRHKGQLANYLAKYIAKSENSTTNKTKSGTTKAKIDIKHVVRLRSFGRVWARSQSLSKIKIVTRWSWDDVEQLLKQFENWRSMVHHRIYDYCEIFYFNFKAMNPLFKRIIHRVIRDIGKSYAYPFPT